MYKNIKFNFRISISFQKLNDCRHFRCYLAKIIDAVMYNIFS